jgi:hypothetical protein
MLALAVAGPLAAQTLPQYRVVAEERSETNRTVDVRIERRLNEADLNAIASVIVNRETRPYMRTVVNFVLPNARPGEPAWANATLVREIRVRIPGLRLDEERLFTAEAREDRRDVIGSWLTSTPATPGRLTIYRDGRKLFAEWRMRNGVRTQDEVSESRVSAGRRFDLKAGASDDHFLIVASGDLEIRAKGTLIALAERIREPSGSAPAIASARTGRGATEAWPPAAADATLEPAQSPQITEPARPTRPITVHRVLPRKPPSQAAPPKIDLSIYLQPQT